MDGYNYYLLDRKTGFSSSDHLFFLLQRNVDPWKYQ